MKILRHLVPLFGAIALIALFFLLPEAPGPGCASCASNSPYLPLVGAGYFSLLIACSLLFPSFPTRTFARGGLTWSIVLAAALTYLHLPLWCPLCLIAHVCHILIWTVWVVAPSEISENKSWGLKERICLAAFAPISVVALFSCMNLTLMAYGFKINHPAMQTGLKVGDQAPELLLSTIGSGDEGYIINFVSSNCPYCKEQNGILNSLASDSHRIINVSEAPFPAWAQGSTKMQWAEDKDGALRQLFQVAGYPTLFVIDREGKVAQVIVGVPTDLKADLKAALAKI